MHHVLCETLEAKSSATRRNRRTANIATKYFGRHLLGCEFCVRQHL